jgi:copper transport protein
VPVAGTVARVSALAGVVVGLLGVSGVVLAVLIVGSFRTAFFTDYGQALLVKLALVAVIGVLAVWNKAYLVKVVSRRPSEQAQWRRLRSAVVDEAALVVLALAVTGLLTMQSPTAPPEGPRAVATDRGAAGTAVRRAELGVGSLQGQLQPASVGVNSFDFTLLDGEGAPLDAPELPEVTATLPSAGLGPLTADVQQLDGPNRFRAELPLPVGGQWQLQVSVQLSSDDSPVAVLDIPVAG